MPALTFSNFMRVESLKERFTYNRAIPVQRLAMAVADSTNQVARLHAGVHAFY